MVRIRLGSSWREEPSLRAALARGGEPAVRRLESATDAVAIEVEGVDIAAGRAEGPLLPALESMARGVTELLSGRAGAQVHFPEGPVELVMVRRAGAVQLSVVALGRPSRLIAEDVEVDLPAFASAVRDAAEGLFRELNTFPGMAASSAVIALRRSLARLTSARSADPAPRAAAPRGATRPRRRRAPVTCTFELRDDDGRIAAYRGPEPDLGSLLAPGSVTVRAAGRLLLSAEGVPFLLLRDLAALGSAIAAAVRSREEQVATALAMPGRHCQMVMQVDLTRGTVAAGEAPPAPAAPLQLARALLEAAVDFCGVAAARNPWQAENGYLSELRRGAAQALGQVEELAEGDVLSEPQAGVRRPSTPRPARGRLGPGELRRLTWRSSWELDADLGPPADGLALAATRSATIATGGRAAAAVGLDGAIAWRADGAAWVAAEGGALLLAAGGRIRRVDPESGRDRWARVLPTPDARPPTALSRLSAGPLLVAGGGALAALDPAKGTLLWRFDPPGAAAITTAALGALAVVAADTGLLYGVDAAGRVAWRLILPGPPAGPPVPCSRLCMVACSTAVGGVILAFDPASGRRAWEAQIDFGPSGPPQHFAGRFAVPGTVAGDPVVAAVDPGGALAWSAAPSLGRGSPAILAGRLLHLMGADGLCTALDRDGSVRWLQERRPLQPPPAGLAPTLIRNVILVPGEPILALDPATGAILGQAELPAAERMIVNSSLGITVLDAEGGLWCAALARHLGVAR